MSDSYEGATPFCDCHALGVTGIEDLVALLNAGVDQRTASLILWAPERVSSPLVVERAGAEAAAFVRRELHARLPWLREVAA